MANAVPTTCIRVYDEAAPNPELEADPPLPTSVVRLKPHRPESCMSLRAALLLIHPYLLSVAVALSSLLLPRTSAAQDHKPTDMTDFRGMTATIKDSNTIEIAGDDNSIGINCPGNNSLTALVFAGRGKLLLVADSGGQVHAHDMQTLIRRQTIQAHKGAISALAASSDGAYFATGGADNCVKLWDARGLREIAATGSPAPISSLAVLASNKVAITHIAGTVGETVRIWDVTRRHSKTFPVSAFLAAFEPHPARSRLVQAQRKTIPIPPRMEWPASSAAKLGAKLRTWTSARGGYTTRAEFLGITHGKIRLAVQDGRIIDVFFEELSEADQAFVRNQHSKQQASNRQGQYGPTRLAKVKEKATSGTESSADRQGPERPDGPRVAFDTLRHDFGSLTSASPVRHKFRFRNTGTRPLLITNVKPGCSCTKVSYYDDQIAPDEVGEISILLDTKDLKDEFFRTISVTTNDPSKPVLQLELIGKMDRT